MNNIFYKIKHGFEPSDGLINILNVLNISGIEYKISHQNTLLETDSFILFNILDPDKLSIFPPAFTHDIDVVYSVIKEHINNGEILENVVKRYATNDPTNFLILQRDCTTTILLLHITATIRKKNLLYVEI